MNLQLLYFSIIILHLILVLALVSIIVSIAPVAVIFLI
jgi:hypothetical protein